LERDFLAGVMLALRSVIAIANAKMQIQLRRMRQSSVEVNCEHLRFLLGWGGLGRIISLLCNKSQLVACTNDFASTEKPTCTGGPLWPPLFREVNFGLYRGGHREPPVQVHG
jgi:hypothetical protein